MNKNKAKKILLILFFIFFNSSMSVFSMELGDDEDKLKVAQAIEGRDWGDNCIVRKGEEIYRITAMVANRDDRDEDYTLQILDNSNPSDFLSEELIIERLRTEDQPFVRSLAHRGIARNEVYWNVRSSNREGNLVPHATYLIQYIGRLSDFNIIKL